MTASVIREVIQHNMDTVLSFFLEGEFLSLGVWSLALGAAAACLILANTDLFLTKSAQACIDYLASTDLKTTGEASELSSLKPQLEQLGVPLYGVVKENVGTEIQDFRPFFSGEIYVDEKQCFYGPKQRKMKSLGIARLGVWQNYIRAWKKGYQGNMKGEGFILGGLYVIGPGKQGILLEHREKDFGDKVDLPSVLKAAGKIQWAK